MHNNSILHAVAPDPTPDWKYEEALRMLKASKDEPHIVNVVHLLLLGLVRPEVVPPAPITPVRPELAAVRAVPSSRKFRR